MRSGGGCRFWRTFTDAFACLHRTSANQGHQEGKKLYLWDWSRIGDAGPKVENLVAFHLLRLAHWMSDIEGERAEVRFLRDTLGREVDFVVLRKGLPWMAIEVKHSEGALSPHLRYFAERLSVHYVFQLAWGAKSDVALTAISGSKVRLTSVARFLANFP